MLYFNVKIMCRLRGIPVPYSWMTRNGISPGTAQKLLNGMHRSLPLDVVEKLCDLLRCTPNDLLSWKPNGNEAADYPLQALKEADHDGLGNLMNDLSQMSVEELKILSEKAAELRKGEE